MEETTIKLSYKERIVAQLKHKKMWMGIVGGTAAGYAYYYFVGCPSGSCPITSNPYASMLYGAVAGYILFSK